MAAVPAAEEAGGGPGKRGRKKRRRGAGRVKEGAARIVHKGLARVTCTSFGKWCEHAKMVGGF